MPNRLAAATSPHLRGCADDAVDWWEWGPEPFAEARRRDVPVLVSVDYATCHGGRLMARESFRDPRGAAWLGERLVAVKVDRDERPDVDAVLLEAATSMTGAGGWPMTLLLDHDGAPFYAAGYLPPEPRDGQPALGTVLGQVLDAWRDRRGEVRAVAAQVRDHLRAAPALAGPPLDGAAVRAAVGALVEQCDVGRGWLGEVPTAPPALVLELLRRAGTPEARAVVDTTVAAMDGGGVRTAAAGFARFALEEGWRRPHPESGLGENALLLGLHARLGTPLGDRVAGEVADVLLGWRTAEGGFGAGVLVEGGDAPVRDEQVVAAGNGLAVSALVDAGRRLDRPDLLDAARGAAALLWRTHVVGGRLRRASHRGVVGPHPAVLQDLGCVAGGFLALAGPDEPDAGDWLARARLLADDALARFRADDGGFHDTAGLPDGEPLVARPRGAVDDALPGGTSAVVDALVGLHRRTGEQRYRTAAEEALLSVSGLAARAPRYAAWSLVAATHLTAGGDGPR